MSDEPDQTMPESRETDWTAQEGLQELERLNNWATPGEWYRHQTDLLAALASSDGPDEEETRGVAEWIDVADAELVVAYRQAVPELVAALKESWRRQAQLEERLRWIADHDGGPEQDGLFHDWEWGNEVPTGMSPVTMEMDEWLNRPLRERG